MSIDSEVEGKNGRNAARSLVHTRKYYAHFFLMQMQYAMRNTFFGVPSKTGGG